MALTKAELKDIARTLKITDTSDFREYLSLIYAEAKLRDPAYTYARMSEHLGVGSTNAHTIISGKRPLTLKTAERIAEALGLTGISKKYFLNTVKKQRARTAGDRDEVFEEQLSLRQRELPTELDRHQLAFFEHWYHAAIMELLRLDHAESTTDWIGANIRPEIPHAKISESLSLLQSLGYLAFDAGRQRLYPTDATISTGNEVLSLALMSFHRQMLKLSLEALDNLPREERDISAITVTASTALFDQFKNEIVAMRKRFLQLSAEDQAATEVVQINFQLFPLVKRKG